MLLLVAIVSYWKNACHAFSDALKLFCLPACLSVCLCLSLSVSQSVSQSVCLSVCLSLPPVFSLHLHLTRPRCSTSGLATSGGFVLAHSSRPLPRTNVLSASDKLLLKVWPCRSCPAPDFSKLLWLAASQGGGQTKPTADRDVSCLRPLEGGVASARPRRGKTNDSNTHVCVIVHVSGS